MNTMIYSIPAILIAIVLHEWAHGYMAYRLGDQSAKLDGRLSLNPLKHIDPMGFIFLLVFNFGWAKPVGVNPHYFKNPKLGMALTALAGPLMNFLISFLSIFITVFVLLHVGVRNEVSQYVMQVLYYLSIISIGLGLFNLLPIPPLDGSKILFALLPEKMYFHYMKYERYGFILLFILLFTGLLNNGLSQILIDVHQFLESIVFMILL